MKRLVAAALLAILAAGPAAAQTTAAPAAAPAPVKGYLSREALTEIAATVPAPPEPGDDAWIADGKTFKRLRALKDAPRWKQAQTDDAYQVDDVLAGFSCPMGIELSSAKTPATARMMGRAVLDATGAAGVAKKRFNRQRPFVPTDEPICIARDADLAASFSYPSGHGAMGWIYGLLLGQVAPDRADALAVRGRGIAQSRAVCGVHWMSDVAVGRGIAGATLTALKANPDFAADEAAARAEIAAAPKAAPGPACAAQAKADVVKLD